VDETTLANLEKRMSGNSPNLNANLCFSGGDIHRQRIKSSRENSLSKGPSAANSMKRSSPPEKDDLPHQVEGNRQISFPQHISKPLDYDQDDTLQGLEKNAKRLKTSENSNNASAGAVDIQVMMTPPIPALHNRARSVMSFGE
jgi:hypothetical protein